MKIRKIAALSAAALLTLSASGCYFFPAEEELLEPPTIAPDEVTYSTYTAKLKTIENTVTVTGYLKSETEKEWTEDSVSVRETTTPLSAVTVATCSVSLSG